MYGDKSHVRLSKEAEASSARRKKSRIELQHIRDERWNGIGRKKGSPRGMGQKTQKPALGGP